MKFKKLVLVLLGFNILLANISFAGPVEDFVRQCYLVHSGREPESQAVVAQWVNAYYSNPLQGLGCIKNGIMNSPEAMNAPVGEWVDQCYQKYLNRGAEPSGRNYWMGICRSQGRAAMEGWNCWQR